LILFLNTKNLITLDFEIQQMISENKPN